MENNKLNTGGIVEHWLYGEKKYEVLVDKDTNCNECIHVEVCDIAKEKRCSNYGMGNSSERGCFSCINRFAKYDEKQPIPCFHCKWFKQKEKTT